MSQRGGGFRGIHHASLLVRNTARSLRFYRDVLGLEVDEARPDLGFPGAWLQVGGGQQIHLLELPNPDPLDRPAHGGRDRHTAFWIEDIEAVCTTLDAAGLAYTLSRSGRKALFCRDPDGNTLELVEIPR